MNEETLYIVMPAYNEEKNIEEVIKQWYPVLKKGNRDSRIIIADSGSTDQTHEKLIKLKESFPQIEIVSESQKQHGPKCIFLYKYSIKNRADWVFQTDSDGQTNPSEFEEFWNLRNEYDAILGNRTARGDGKIRAFVEKIVCFLLKIYFRTKIPDANAPFRLMKASMLEKYINKLPDDYNLPNIILSAWFVYNKEKVIFKEISFKPRKAGKNSVNISKIIKIGWKALGDFRKFKKDMIKNDANSI